MRGKLIVAIILEDARLRRFGHHLCCSSFGLLFSSVTLWRSSAIYVDNNYSFAKQDNLTYYAPYKKLMPTDKVKLLLLWDEINLPHSESKQIFGPIIPCIGFEVDPNAMMVTIFVEGHLASIDACEQFIKIGA
jgi:hypothetical protein